MFSLSFPWILSVLSIMRPLASSSRLKVHLFGFLLLEREYCCVNLWSKFSAFLNSLTEMSDNGIFFCILQVMIKSIHPCNPWWSFYKKKNIDNTDSNCFRLDLKWLELSSSFLYLYVPQLVNLLFEVSSCSSKYSQAGHSHHFYLFSCSKVQVNKSVLLECLATYLQSVILLKSSIFNIQLCTKLHQACSLWIHPEVVDESFHNFIIMCRIK